MDAELITTIEPKAGKGFVETPFVKGIIGRAMNYMKAGFPVHFRGVSGTGKTTLALRIAQLLGRPVMLIHGDEAMDTGALVGSESGYSMRKVRDNFIHSVLKIEEEMDKHWVDNRLTVAVEQGFTLIYDEFTRSRPEANNVLLPILQEGLLALPVGRGGDEVQYIKAHPEFSAIFTSNPEEYAGVHRAQDALRDRMITLDLQPFDEETEVSIAQAKSGLPKDKVKEIIKVVRALRDSGQYEFSPTVRAGIMIARSVAANDGHVLVSAGDKMFRRICLDILTSEASRSASQAVISRVQKIVDASIDKFCGNGGTIVSKKKGGQSGKRSQHHKGL